jgi:hypothetical protein
MVLPAADTLPSLLRLWLFAWLPKNFQIGNIYASYLDCVQAKVGSIHIIYDHQPTPLGEVLMATFTEEDIRAGEPVSGRVRLHGKVARLPIGQADAQAEP